MKLCCRLSSSEVRFSFVLSKITRLTDGRTDGQTAFSWLERVACNAYSAVKMSTMFIAGYHVATSKCNIDLWHKNASRTWKLAFSLQRSHFDPTFQVRGRPLPVILPVSKTSINVLSYGVRIWAQLFFVLSQITHLTDERTDRQTDSFLVARTNACNACSAVKNLDNFIAGYHVATSTPLSAILSPWPLTQERATDLIESQAC